jgi:hypothetical protein
LKVVALCIKDRPYGSAHHLRTNRNILLVAAAGLTCVIALADWYTRPFISIGFLYLFPMMLISGVLKRWQIVTASVACAILQELYSNLPLDNAVPRLIFSWFGFAGTGLFLFELLSSTVSKSLPQWNCRRLIRNRTARNWNWNRYWMN